MHPTPHPTSLALGHLPLEGKSLACCGQHVFNEDAVAAGGVVYQHVCVLMIPTKPLNFRKPRIQVNYDFAIGSLIVINLFKNDL